MKILFLLLIPILVNAQEKKDTSIYILKGKIPDFQMLYKAVTQPRDVTPNQQEAIAKWIEGIKPEKEKADSTK
jgi:hypothetical protein